LRAATDRDRTLVTANNCIITGNSLRSKSEAESNRQAIIQYENALALHKQINDKAGQALSLLYIARIYETRSDYKKALEYYSSALTLWHEVKDRRGEAKGRG